MLLLHFVHKYLIRGMKESLQSKMTPRYLYCSTIGISVWSILSTGSM